MVDQAANMLLETLRDLLIEEVRFLSGVSGKVKQMERDLRSIHGLLMEADKRRNNSQTLQDCIVELKDLATKAENVLENYAVEVESKRGKSLKKKLGRFIGILCECYSVHQAGNEVDGIRSRLGELTNKLSSVNGGEGPSNAVHEEQQRLLRLRYAHEIEQHFVGMEKDIECVVSMVKDESSLSPTVISICGMGGLGKTTLARKIYHHENVIGRFGGRRVWVCVTQQFEAKTVLREIFKQVDKNRAGIDGMESYELVRELHSVLEQREWLIVIDDIWESPHWAILKPAFPMNCKVVLTTRNEQIDVASEEFRVHKLDFLSEDDGWELLRKITFPINDACLIVTKPIEDEGRLIVERCGRLPLAISVIGGILRQKQQRLDEWKNVRSNIESYLKNGEGIGNDNKGVKLVLDLSFDVLPYYLKSCFLYLACFPEDHKIDTEQLYLLWMAEGFISSEEKENNESLRDVAQRYLTELAYRCMVQVEKDEDDFTRSKFTTCRLHDLMRDLCSSKAVERKFLKCIEISKHQHDVPCIDRVAINILEADDDTLSKRCMLELEDLRSFLIHSRIFGMKVNVENIVNLETSKHLKILVFRMFAPDKGKLPSAVYKLVHLRYLGLYQCYVEELPQNVCYLPYVNTLDLRVSIAPMKLPNLIWKMKRLRHLFLNEEIQVIGGDKLRLEGLTELETLVGICSETACIADVANLTNLRILSTKINDRDNFSKIVEYMSSNQCKLQETSLSVWCDFGRGEEDRSVVKKMLMSPSLVDLTIINNDIGLAFSCYEQGMCSNLVKLQIYSSKIGVLVEELGKYPILQSLQLTGDEDEEMRFGANSFPELKILILFKFFNLKKWEVEEGAMPKLRILQMWSCMKLEKLPDALRFIPNLQELTCYIASSELKDRMRGGGGGGGENGEDYANFSHIPFIHIE